MTSEKQVRLDPTHRFYRQELGFSPSQVSKIKSARFLITAINQTENHSVLVDSQIRSEFKADISVEIVTNALSKLACVTSIAETEKGSDQDHFGIDLIVNLKNRNLNRVFVQVKSSAAHVERFYEMLQARYGLTSIGEVRYWLLKNRIIVIIGTEPEQVQRYFLGTLRHMEELHQKNGSRHLLFNTRQQNNGR